MYTGLSAQTSNITGKVKISQSAKDTLSQSNIYVRIPSLNAVTVTDPQGQFRFKNLKNKDSYELQFTKIGLKAQKVIAKSGEFVEITMTPDNLLLQGVDVAAYKVHNISLKDSVIDLGIWKNMASLDIPFSVTTLSAEAMKDLQVTTLNEASKYFPSMQIEARGGIEVGRPQTRGFEGSVVECTRLDGMNIVSTTSYPMEQFDQLQVINGLVGSMYGPAAPAGSFNYVSKRVKEKPSEEISLQMQSKTIAMFHGDISNSYSDGKNSIGYRLDGLYSDGTSYVDFSDITRFYIGGSVDATIGKLDIHTNISRYNYQAYGLPGGINITALIKKGVDLPKGLDPTKEGYGQSWAGLNLMTITESAKLIYHINDKWNVEAGILKQRVDRGTQNQTLKLTSDSTYTATVSLQGDPGWFGIVSHLININGTAKTGSIKHNIAFGTNGFNWSNYSSNSSSTTVTLGSGDIYNPTVFASPSDTLYPSSAGLIKGNSTIENVINLGDKIQFTDKFSALLSASYNWYKTSTYNRGGMSFTGSLMYKFHNKLSFYAIYSDVLQAGEVSPSTDDVPGLLNPNEMMDPARSTQYEIGLKSSFKTVDFTLAAFRMDRPFYYTKNYLYQLEGQQVNKGIEFTTDATFKNLHILGGITYLNPKLTQTSDSTTTGKQVVAVPKLQANALVEYKIPGIPDISINGNLHYVGKKPADDTNSQYIDAYSTCDFGIRYKFNFMNKKFIWNIQGLNVFNEKYFASVFATSTDGDAAAYNIFMGTPAELRTSVRIIF